MAVQNQRDATKSTTPAKIATAKKKTIYNSAMATASTPHQQQDQQKFTNKMQSSQQMQQQQANGGGGPRVSFNRDVHVKRIAKHPNEITNFEATPLNANAHKQQQQQQQQTFQQLPPADLANINKEAALVLQQASSYKSKAENGENIPTFRVKTKVVGAKKFHSLPNRKKKGPGKPVTRSASDASSKKPVTKRPSIFSLFSRKSDSNLNQAADKDPRFEDSGGRRLVRSKSDVGSATAARKLRKPSKDTKNSVIASSSKQLPTQLSPIIENAQKEDFFEKHFQRERRKSDAITDREKHESAVDDLLEVSPNTNGDSLLGKNPISNSIKAKILTLQAKSNENMHSSQLPAQKLPLTKGRTVNGMVKRLSMERFSPPPTMTQPAFSYIRPNDGIHYAELEQQLQQNALQRARSPIQEFGLRDFVGTPERDLPTTLNKTTAKTSAIRESIDRTDHYKTSQKNYKNANNYGGSVLINDRFSPVTGPTTIRISTSHSPSPWQQLSPRNLSDEDEGLGIETRKYYDDELSSKIRAKSPAEPPIVPVIRSITPPPHELNAYNHHNRHNLSHEDLVDDLGYRRQRLESRILTRRFGDTVVDAAERNGYHRQSSQERYRLQRYLSAEPELPVTNTHNTRFHKPQTAEILNKYSPERSHLDIISPNTVPVGQGGITTITTSTTNVTTLPKTSERTYRYKHSKFYDEGQRDTTDGEPFVHESRRTHYDHSPVMVNERDYNSAERQLINDNEPKSLDSQFTTNTEQYRYTPEYMKRYDASAERSLTQKSYEHGNWQSTSLKRDKLQQRSFDKGDSGIENDFRKESFNGDISNRWRKRSTIDDIKSCELFLKKERRHTEELMRNAVKKKPLNGTHYPHQHQNFVYRERSIDDGSHYDPHLDKYSETATSTLRRREHHAQSAQAQTGNSSSTLKRTNKKLGGFEKVKQLFTGSKDYKKDNGSSINARANSTTSSSGAGAGGTNSITTTITTTRTLPLDKSADKYMVKEEEMRSRYREHRANALQNEPKATDISMRRRLSTPKASPLLLKRTSSDKTKKASPLAKPEKMSWFKSLDRRAKSKSKEKLNVSVNGQSETTSSMKRTTSSAKRAASVPATAKNLRFFGDTDLDSNPPTISKTNTKPKTRQSLPTTTPAANLNRSQKYSQSAHHLDRLNNSPQHDDYRHTLASQGRAQSRHKSTSLHNLNNDERERDEVDFRSKRRHYSRSRDLDDISESASETDNQHKRNNGVVVNGSHAGHTPTRERLDRSQRYEEHNYHRSNDRPSNAPQLSAHTPNGGVASDGDVISSSKKHPQQRRTYLMGPPKPARSAERRLLPSYPRERDRFPAESSGTEGESSLQSQRSVVYLHATTVGAIPQPYHLRRRSISRDDLRSQKTKIQQREPPLQPMTRTVSRSVSMLAPWKPKLISDGYEINYSQEQNKNVTRTLPRHQHLNGTRNANTTSLTRPSRNKSETPIRRFQNSSHEHLKDDQSSLRN